MVNKFKNYFKSWAVKNARGPYANFWLAVLSFSEASFFIIPPDVLLLAVLVVNPAHWIYRTSLVTFFSVLGGLFGYFLGFVFFDPIWDLLVATFDLEEQMLMIAEQFSENAFWAIFLSAFTPIPYKLFTISAGFFHINLVEFMVASIIGRGLRFFSVAYIVKVFGRQMAHYAFKYFNILTLIFIVIVVLSLLF
jgi:membrane protein YqaA with SNARE-associated domain